MRCTYCFYREEMADRAQADCGMMTEATLRLLIEQAFALAEQSCTFAFQGGEPTLAGIPFYEEFHRLVEQYNQKGIPVQYALQTNGLLVNDEWANLWVRHKYLIGLSIDGPADLHNRFRKDAAGEGTFQRVMQAAEVLRAHGVEFNVLTVVSYPSAANAAKLHQFFQKHKLPYRQYIPLVASQSKKEAYTLTADRYGKFLCDLFDAWYKDICAGVYTYDRTFSNWIGMLRGQPPECCGMSGVCTPQLVIEANGNVYPCDFYATDEYLAGNIHSHTLEELWQSILQSDFATPSLTPNETCKTCPYFALCRGGCRRYREQKGGALGINTLCAGYKRFFPYALPRLLALARGATFPRV